TTTFKKESVSGYYGPVTEKAVREFQQKFGLVPSGITEPATRYLFNKFYYNQLCPKPDHDFLDFRLADVNKKSSLPANYVPSDLVNINTDDMQTRGVLCLRQETATALQDIFNDAKNLNFGLRVTSAFRKPELQKLIIDTTSASRNYVALPLYSEHQLGTAIDITSKGVKYRPTDTGFAKTVEGKWLLENAWRYGFVLSYPDGKNAATGYNYEPWHIRYVGQDVAQILHEQNITFTEYVANILKK
ncbi:MAG: D-alanyl-D-alanine carboxypeptidase family protein, partial [bacterium]